MGDILFIILVVAIVVIGIPGEYRSVGREKAARAKRRPPTQNFCGETSAHPARAFDARG